MRRWFRLPILICSLFLSSEINKWKCDGVEVLEEYIHVWIIHGSWPKPGTQVEIKRLGGLLGGHVEVQIDSLLYGFEYADRTRLSIFPKSGIRRNANFTMKSVSQWSQSSAMEKKTRITIPVSCRQKDRLLEYYNSQRENPQYDYAVFGYRCASSLLDALVTVDILKGTGLHWLDLVVSANPRLLRIWLQSIYPDGTEVFQGSDDFFWE